MKLFEMFKRWLKHKPPETDFNNESVLKDFPPEKKTRWFKITLFKVRW